MYEYFYEKIINSNYSERLLAQIIYNILETIKSIRQKGIDPMFITPDKIGFKNNKSFLNILSVANYSFDKNSLCYYSLYLPPVTRTLNTTNFSVGVIMNTIMLGKASVMIKLIEFYVTVMI
jgi:hypothetical protein